ncbi:MAG: glucose-6-phosphate dehydrogenase, partial [Cyanobacteria bacterium P01_F01_bin.53]
MSVSTPTSTSASKTASAIQSVGPCVMVIFGATGDLTKRKLIPALYNLAQQNLLPDQFSIVGIGRTAMHVEDFKDKILSALKEFATGDVEEGLLNWLAPRLQYLSGDFQSPETYQQLKEILTHIDQE